LKSQNFRVLKYHYSSESVTPFLSFSEILRSLFKISKYDTENVRIEKIFKEIKENIPELEHIIPIIDKVIVKLPIQKITFAKEREKIDSSNLKFMLRIEDTITKISQLFSMLSKKQPIGLFIDDLHLADNSSLLLFQNLTKKIQKSKFILIGTYRKEALTATVDVRTNPFLNFLQRMDKFGFFNKIELQRLNEKNTLLLINSILGINFDELGNEIYNETEGNPFFILETLRLLINKKYLIRKNDRWKLEKNIKNLQIPIRIHDVIAHRIESLEINEKEILEFASVIGKEFSYNLIQLISDSNR